MKLIAVAKKGKEFVHSTERAYFAPDSSADRIAKSLNENKYMLCDVTIRCYLLSSAIDDVLEEMNSENNTVLEGIFNRNSNDI